MQSIEIEPTGAKPRRRVVSVGISRLFRVVEIDGTIPADYRPNLSYQIQQAVKDPLTKKWRWVPLALATQWGEAHGAMHQMQADFGDRMLERESLSRRMREKPVG